ncbi:MAG: FCD domain-containing protein [Thermoanaerobacteraceae bacterium]|nr:FCD domain-containing protein [Thermoanaerobacteraceae bacterium]
MTEREAYEYQILSIIAGKVEPIGAGALSKELRARNINISEATVGRILSDMDIQGLTEKIGFQGRKLTEKGMAHLEKLKKIKNRHLHSRELLRLLQEKGCDMLLELLVARRAIEREIARLAAINATDEEIQELIDIEKLQEERQGECGTSAEEDVRFHRAIARAAKNKVLQAAIELIREDGQLSPILEYIRKEVHSVIAIDHRKIVEAIANRDPEAAEKAMVQHIENLMADVKKYCKKEKSGDRRG